MSANYVAALLYLSLALLQFVGAWHPQPFVTVRKRFNVRLLSTAEDVTTNERKSRWIRKDLFGKSLVDQTLKVLDTNVAFQEELKQIKTLGLEERTKKEVLERQEALNAVGVSDFLHFVHDKQNPFTKAARAVLNVFKKNRQPQGFVRKTPQVLQLSLGSYCNQACEHCHTESSPLRTESMTTEIAARCLELLKSTPSITTLDITGGAPELQASFRYLVAMARQLFPDLEIIDRSNLTILQEPGQEDLVDFLKKHRVHIIASMPCYTAPNVNQQRGDGVFDRSIAALLALNEAGYGREADLVLDLAYNPLSGYLPSSQAGLQADYKKQLYDNYGVVFHSLHTQNNVPITRFADFLKRRLDLSNYMKLLANNFNRNTLKGLMCLNTVNVGYDGKVSGDRAGLACIMLLFILPNSPDALHS